MFEIDRVNKKLTQLTVYHKINREQLIERLKSTNQSANNGEFPGDILYQLIKYSEERKLAGDIWQNYLRDLILKDENPFSLACENTILDSETSLYQATLHDLKIIQKLLAININELIYNSNKKELGFATDYTPAEFNCQKTGTYRTRGDIPDFTAPAAELLSQLNEYYNHHGAGQLNQYRAFRWHSQQQLVPVHNPDNINFDNLMGYQQQQEQLIQNTEAFIRGKTAHNVLLYGDSGTGKSSSVKAVLNKFAPRGLRLIEINNQQIKELPAILEYLSQRGLNFIIFMDDLSFEEFETEYKYLKAVMEGGIEARPDHVLFYATSNRRHLVQEKWQDREDEVHQGDMINERLSLSERFGLTILFNSPDKQQYLQIVRGLADQEGIELPKARLEEKALKWEMWNNGRSGRSARQFIDSLK